MLGNYNGTLVPVAVDQNGAIISSGFLATDILDDSVEATTWDATLTSIVNNLNRIRNQIVTITGQTWGTVTTTLVSIMALFNATTGHKHTGAANDAPILPHAGLSGLANDDHTQYYLVVGTRRLTAGIPFPATNVPSSDVNTLDDYVEGTFTPDLLFNSNNIGMTYSIQTGLYTKIGNMVFFTIELALTSKGTSTGVATVYGLPYQSASILGNVSTISVSLQNVSTTGVCQPSISRNGWPINLYQITDAGVRTQMDNTNFTDTSVIILTGSYRAAT